MKNSKNIIKNIKNKTSYLKYMLMIFSVLSSNDLSSLPTKQTKDNIYINFNINHRDDLEWETQKHETIINKNIEQLTLTEFETHLLIEVNKYRLEYNLEPLVLNRNLCDVAQSHADYMSKDNYGHEWATEETMTSGKRIENSDYNKSNNIFTTGENIAYGQRTIKQLMDERMNSPWHKSNILNSDFKDMWIAYTKWIYTSTRWVKWEWLFFCQVFWAKIQ